jgi:hypothetical protein
MKDQVPRCVVWLKEQYKRGGSRYVAVRMRHGRENCAEKKTRVKSHTAKRANAKAWQHILTARWSFGHTKNAKHVNESRNTSNIFLASSTMNKPERDKNSPFSGS